MGHVEEIQLDEKLKGLQSTLGDTPLQSMWRIRLSLAIRLMIGLLLILAVVFRSILPGEAATLVFGYGIPGWFLVALTQIEILLACLLVGGVFHHFTLSLAGIMFLAFAIFSFYRAYTGEDSCGCFGAVSISPWLTLMLSGSCLFGLYTIRNCRPTVCTNRRFLSTLMLYLVLAVSLYLWSTSSAPQLGLAEINESPGVSLHQGLILLEPNEWNGKLFPLVSFLVYKDEHADIENSEWILLFHRHDCPKCIELKSHYESLSDARGQVLLIEVPPFSHSGPLVSRDCLTAHLPDNQDWFIQTPTVVRLVDGFVDSISVDLSKIIN